MNAAVVSMQAVAQVIRGVEQANTPHPSYVGSVPNLIVNALRDAHRGISQAATSANSYYRIDEESFPKSAGEVKWNEVDRATSKDEAIDKARQQTIRKNIDLAHVRVVLVTEEVVA